MWRGRWRGDGGLKSQIENAGEEGKERGVDDCERIENAY